ncbi:MAG: hypothetical protein WC677_08230 [Clostridia bacterium]
MVLEVTDDMIKNLTMAITSNFTKQKFPTTTLSKSANQEKSFEELLPIPAKKKESPAKKESSRFDFGAIWHGNLHSKAEEGTFGSASKPNHFAMIRDNVQVVNKPGRSLSPITSKSRDAFAVKDVLVLSPGELDTFIQKKSYILLYLTLLVTRKTLYKEFKFIQMLQPEHIKEARRILSNGY